MGKRAKGSSCPCFRLISGHQHLSAVSNELLRLLACHDAAEVECPTPLNPRMPNALEFSSHGPRQT